MKRMLSHLGTTYQAPDTEALCFSAATASREKGDLTCKETLFDGIIDTLT